MYKKNTKNIKFIKLCYKQSANQEILKLFQIVKLLYKLSKILSNYLHFKLYKLPYLILTV